MNGKTLTFEKISLAIFMHYVTDVYYFPDDSNHNFYSQNKIIKYLI